MTNCDWTEEEIELLKTYYPVGGANLCREKGLTKSLVKINNKASRLSICYRKISHIWLKEEIELLKKYYPIGGAKLCKQMGLTKNVHSIENKAIRLELCNKKKYSNWSKKELALLEKYYPIGGVDLCKEKGLDRPVSTIILKARLIGLGDKKYWTDKELSKVTKYYPIGGAKLCQEKGVDKSNYSIFCKARNLGISVNKGLKNKWSETELNILKTYYIEGGAKLCQDNGVNKAIVDIRRKAVVLGLDKTFNSKRKWELWEIEILKEYYAKGGTNLCIEKGIDRSAFAIVNRANKLGLKKIKKRLGGI